MSKTHLVFSDRHCQPNLSNDFCDWIGKLILDLKPDVVVDNGDGFDFPSLCSYDRGTRSFQGRSYGADITAGVEGIDRIWTPIRKAKRKLPRRIYTIGNHEHRVWKTLNLSPELDGAISTNDMQLEDYYNTVIPYSGATPGVIEVDGVYYAHFLVSGIKGLPIGGDHPAYSLIAKQGASCTVGHSHLLDFHRRVGVDGRTRLGLVTGTCSPAAPGFAGLGSSLWWRGLVIKRNVENGNYDPQFVSLEDLRREYAR
jgi:hypothetical protein